MERIAFIYGETFIYWSSVIVALAVACAAIMFLAIYIGRSGNAAGGAVAVALSMGLSIILSRFIHWYCMEDSYESLHAAMTDYSTGSYALMGVFAACLIVAVLLRLTRLVKNLPQMLDAMCIAGALGIGLGRLACLYNTENRGAVLHGITELPIAYPVTGAVTGSGGGAVEYRLATFMIQAIAAGVIFLVLLTLYLAGKRKGKLRDGDACLLFLLLYGALQAIMDSTRYDSLYFRSNGFVSIVQILGAVALVIPIVLFSIRMVRARRFRWWYSMMWMTILLLLVCAGVMEYYVQRRGEEALFFYSIMGVCLALTVVLGLAIWIITVTGEKGPREELASAKKRSSVGKYLRG